MDFLESINEDLDVRYEEISEFGDPVFVFVGISDNMNHRFFPEDLKSMMELLGWMKEHPNLDLTKNINESYTLKYYGMSDGDESVLVLEDLDNNEKYNLYSEDIIKIVAFLNRLIKFGVIKNAWRYVSKALYL